MLKNHEIPKISYIVQKFPIYRPRQSWVIFFFKFSTKSLFQLAVYTKKPLIEIAVSTNKPPIEMAVH